jgi:hypothetical protein
MKVVMTENRLRDEICRGESLFDRYVHATAGNISVRPRQKPVVGIDYTTDACLAFKPG